MSFSGTRERAWRLLCILLISGAPTPLIAQASAETMLADDPSSLPAAPSALLAASSSPISPADEPKLSHIPPFELDTVAFPRFEVAPQSKTNLNRHDEEPYHWKGLLLQSFGFDVVQNATRIITARQSDRHLL